jgi:uncharacterized OsmC-like protein
MCTPDREGVNEMAEKILNGVDVGKVEEAVSAFKADPSLAKFKFRINNKWIDGGHNITTVGKFYGAGKENSHKSTIVLEADEPSLLAGSDLAANPVEHLLNALASCLTSTLIYHAALRGIKIDELESELVGDIDLRGFLGISNEVRRGYENIRVNFRIKTDEKSIDKLKALSKLSPVFDVTSNGTRVDVNIERMEEKKAA